MNEDDYPDFEWDEPSEYETDPQYGSTDCKPYQ